MLGELQFAGAWRHYQELALDAFEADRAAGRRSTHLVAPPGSGKTLLGFEILRRLGAPALVLAPNSAIQAQWVQAGAAFGAPAGLVAAAPGAAGRLPHLPGARAARRSRRRAARRRGGALGGGARGGDRRAGGRGRRGGRALDGRGRAPAPSASWPASPRRSSARSRAAATAAVRLADLLAPGARERVDALRAGGVATVVLDECHHLASLWGYVVRAVLEELGGDVHVVGLTATPPDELTTQEAELYEALLGPVDFQVPTPAVVRDGFLAPYRSWPG